MFPVLALFILVADEFLLSNCRLGLNGTWYTRLLISLADGNMAVLILCHYVYVAWCKGHSKHFLANETCISILYFTLPVQVP